MFTLCHMDKYLSFYTKIYYTKVKLERALGKNKKKKKKKKQTTTYLHK